MSRRDLERGTRERATGRIARLVPLVVALASILAGSILGETYISRLPHHDGYFLVPVEDEVRAPRPSRPRHTAFILIDGLRRDAAETMKSTTVLLRSGQCRVSDQGRYTISRPEYALLSTGLEVDRSGARNNDLTAPLAAESIWQIARHNGLSVGGSSHLPWFRQLFPDGFDEFTLAQTHDDNVFATRALHDVDVFHPLYVDENGHQHGAASGEYAAAVARADEEITGLLARLDLTRDLVILTADHGHRDEGGHGGAQPEIRNVLTCFAGLGVERDDARHPFDGRSTSPLLAVMLGLPFPRQMRAGSGEDGLDAIWEIAHEGPGDQAFFQDRRAAIEKFREANRVTLEGWLGGRPGTWARLYAREADKQTARAALAALAVGLLLALRHRWRRRRARGQTTLASAAWIPCVALVLWATHHLTLGDFDYTVINRRERFIVRAFATVFLSAVAGVVAHGPMVGPGWRASLRRLDRLVADWTVVVGLILAANLAHVFVYGWPLGFPLPVAPARYFPFFGSILLIGYALILVGLVVVERIARRGAQKRRAPQK